MPVFSGVSRVWYISGAVILAGIVIASFIVRVSYVPYASVESINIDPTTLAALDVRAPSPEDHVRGGSDAAVYIIEYSDLQCTFCRSVHPTIARLVREERGVAWVYRHFPLDNIHPRATPAAAVAECVAHNAGNEAFWEFVDAVFDAQHDLSDDALMAHAAAAGASESSVAACTAAGEGDAAVSTDRREAQRAGGRGTPFFIVATADGEAVTFSGALSYEQIRSIVDTTRAL